jgi:predicted amidohydrolase
MNLQVHKWMKQLAAQTGSIITGTVIISEGGNYYNRLLWVLPDGTTQYYDKRHLFRMANEDTSFASGTELPIFSLKGWKICPQICYDLRFPIWARNHWNSGNAAYDLLFYVASWPAARVSAWDTLLPARAIENLSYVIGVNRVGIDGNQIAYTGHSAAYDFKGERLVDLGEKDQIQVVTLSRSALEEYRTKFPAWKDADNFTLLE